MFYREAGQYKTTYADDMAVFPILQDRIGIGVILAAAFLLVPLVGSQFLIASIMIPFLVFSLAAIGLNLLTGYTGLISLGTGAFMGVGAYACYKLTTIFPSVNIVVWIVASGFFSAAIGVLFGLPSLRIKGFYLAVATLAAQFFLQWSFVRIPWLYNYNSSGAIEVPERMLMGLTVTGPRATPTVRYLVLLSIVVGLTWVASNIVHGRVGRMWMAVRDMDIAAELMGIRLLPTKLLAFAISSFYCGVAGACMMFLWYGGGEANDAFNINQSFNVLFMVIIGGLGSLIGSFFGSFFITSLPTLFKFYFSPIAKGLIVIALISAAVWLFAHGRSRQAGLLMAIGVAAAAAGAVLAFAAPWALTLGPVTGPLAFTPMLRVMEIAAIGMAAVVLATRGQEMPASVLAVIAAVVGAMSLPLNLTISSEAAEHLTFMLVGSLIIIFLIVEPHGLARLWQIGKQKLRTWPFPY